MPSICLIFTLHQPRRLRYYTFFDIGQNHDYEDAESGRQRMEKLSEKCYLPANALILGLIRKHGRSFKVSCGISGLFLEQLRRSRGKVIDSFRRLADTGCVEFLGGTYHHSLAFLYSKKEFEDQVRLQREMVEDLFGDAPVSFQNAGLIYNDDLAGTVEKQGFRAILAEGTDRILGGKSRHFIYRPPKCRRLGLLLRNNRLSDDISFRFSDRTWSEFPLTAEKYAAWVHRVKEENAVINILVDYETLGERQWEETGIFEFMKALPGEIMKKPGFRFSTPAEAVKELKHAGELSVPDFVSCAGEEKDLEAWRGNHLQRDALKTLYGLSRKVRLRKDDRQTETWRSLQASDHIEYMGNRWHETGESSLFFNPYPSPYDAYINYMNVLTDFSMTLKEKARTTKKKGKTRRASKTG
jgi:alpha-amylase